MADDKDMADRSSKADHRNGPSSDALVPQSATDLTVVTHNDAPYIPGEHAPMSKKRKHENDVKPWHVNPIHFHKPDEARLDKDQLGNIVIRKIRKDGKGPVWNNIGMYEATNDSIPTRVVATFDHPEAFKTLANQMASTASKSSKWTVTYMEHNQGDIPAPPAGSNLTLPMLPFQRESAWDIPKRGSIQPEAEKCANCLQFGHRLADCVVPSEKHWDIFGCPLCNTRAHAFDECPNLEYLTHLAKFNLLGHRRAGKPLIRTEIDVYDLARKIQAQNKCFDKNLCLPWTREGCALIWAKHKEELLKADYTGANARAGRAIDNWATFDTVINTDSPPNGSFSYWKEKSKAYVPPPSTTTLTIRGGPSTSTGNS